MALWSTFKRRFNNSLGFRMLLTAFVGSATVFSALPLLRYLRGHTILITNSGTPPANVCWRAMKSSSFAPANTISCIRRHARSFWQAQVCSGKEGSFSFL